MIGATINSRYDIKMLIGDGGMANVYLAYDRTLADHVAIKTLRYELSKDERFIKRFKRESEQVLNLEHENIVHVYAIGDYQDQPFIVMEYVRGSTLKDYLRDAGALRVEEALYIMKQLVSGVAYAHQNKIIHRDLKTQNIMLTDESKIKITDFGIALSSNEADITQTNTIMGSVHYLAPELARGNIANERSDIYALGIILYELLTGTVPFKGEGAVNIALQHLEAKMPSIKSHHPEIPDNFDIIIRRCTHKTPAKRYGKAEELLLDLERAMDDHLLEDFDGDESEQTMIIPNLEEDVEDVEQVGRVRKKPKVGFLSPVIALVYTVLFVMAFYAYYLVVFAPARELSQIPEVRIPDVSGMTATEAERIFREAGLPEPTIRFLENEDYEEGQVFRTMPAAGELIRLSEYTTITLHVAE